MAELNDVLGSILKDVARSRVISDLFSRDVSLEYSKDELLGAFPVPRVEIKELTVGLKFAINSVGRRMVNPDDVKKQLVSEAVAQLSDQLHSDLILSHPNRDELQRIIQSKGVIFRRAEYLTTIGQVILERIDDLDSPEQQQAITAKVRSLTERGLRESSELWEVMKRGIKIAEIQKLVDDRTMTVVAKLAKDMNLALQALERQNLAVDIAASKTELIDVPEAILSQISVVAGIRNYEWVEVTEDDKVIRRLRPE